MARTWTLHSTLTVTTGGALQANSRALTNDAGTEVYFIISDSPNQKIYSWDGTTLTDIAGSTFPVGTNSFIGDICVFDGDLFCGYGPIRFAGGPGTDMYRWTGGTSWTNEYTLFGEPANAFEGWIAEGYSAGGDEADSWVWPMDCDASYMTVVGTLSSHSGQAFNRFWTRNTSGAWVINEVTSGVFSMPGYHLVGLSKGSDYGTVFGYDRLSSTDFRPMERANPSPWSYLTGAGIGRRIPMGYGGGFSFWSHNTGTNVWELKKSTDFGANVTAAGGLTRTGGQKASFKFKNLGSGIIMLSVDSFTAYTFNSGTGVFDADGTTSTQTIYDFFILNGELFALTNSATANSVEIWSAGMVSSAGFYYGRAGLQYRAALPFGFLNIGAMAIAHPLAFIGNGASAPTMVGYFSPPNYDQFTDFTASLADDPISSFDSTPYGDSSGASESGEDAGPGGHLGEKC